MISVSFRVGACGLESRTHREDRLSGVRDLDFAAEADSFRHCEWLR